MGLTERNGRTGAFMERTLVGVVSLLKGAVSNEETASRNGFLQRVDPRLKTLSVAALLVSVLLTKNVLSLCAIYLACLAVTVASSLGLGFFLKRTLLFVPIFSGFVVLPALLNVVTPGESVFDFQIFSRDLSITRQGIDSAVMFFMRVLTSVSLAALLVLTTRHHVLLKVLRIFKVPQLFVMTMGMAYRYIYLLLDIVHNTFTSIKSRVGYVTASRAGRRIVAANMAGLWLRSYRLQSQVYDAMLSRGYTGEPRVLVTFRARMTDFVILTAAASTIVLTLWLNHFSR